MGTKHHKYIISTLSLPPVSFYLWVHFNRFCYRASGSTNHLGPSIFFVQYCPHHLVLFRLRLNKFPLHNKASEVEYHVTSPFNVDQQMNDIMKELVDFSGTSWVNLGKNMGRVVLETVKMIISFSWLGTSFAVHLCTIPWLI